MRGRKPTPTAILRVRGSRWAKRPGEPEPTEGGPDRPSWLSPDAAAIWDETVYQLAGMNVLHRCDANSIARYADAMAQWKEAGASLPLSKGDDARRARQWYVQLATILLKLEQEFGLTPSARTRIRIGDKTKEKPQGFAALRLAQ